MADAQTPNSAVPDSIALYMTSDPRSDLAWIHQSFLLPNISGNEISPTDMANRRATTAAFNYNDTTLGGSWALNMPPQFTEFADIAMGGDASHENAPGRTTMTTDGSYGMGRLYHERIATDSQLITMSFGVQAFNSLSSFFGNFYDPNASMVARSGRSEGLFYTIGKAAGSLMSVPFIPITFGSQVIKNLLNIPSTKFAYFKSTMPVYWNAVNTILNGITANLGTHYRQLSTAQKAMYDDPGIMGMPSTDGTQYEQALGDMSKFLPNIYTSKKDSDGNIIGGQLDVYAVASRAQQLDDQFTQKLQAAMKSSSDMASFQTAINGVIGTTTNPVNLARPKQMYLSDVLQTYLNSTGGTTQGFNGPIEPAGDPSSPTTSSSNDNASNDGSSNSTAGSSPDNSSNNSQNSQSSFDSSLDDAMASQSTESASNNANTNRFGNWLSSFMTALTNDLHDGSGYITFRTDYGGAMHESFSNSMRESDLQSKINNMSSSKRFAEFDLAGGNLVGGALGAVTGKILSTVGETITGYAAGMHISGLAALAGAAYVDIPKMFDSTSANLPSQTFTIELRAWSGDKISLLQDIYVPLACLLAGVLPRQTGPESYNGPFSCRLFAKGRMQVQNGLITDMSISRGVGNRGFNADGLPMGIDVTFTVTDFSSVIAMPIVASTGFFQKAIAATGDAAGSVVDGLTGGGNSGQQTGEAIAAALSQGTYSDTSLFSDYLAVLSGLDWKDQLYSFRRLSIMIDQQRLNWESFKSPYHAAGWFAGTLPGRALSLISRGTDRP